MGRGLHPAAPRPRRRALLARAHGPRPRRRAQALRSSIARKFTTSPTDPTTASSTPAASSSPPAVISTPSMPICGWPYWTPTGNHVLPVRARPRAEVRGLAGDRFRDRPGDLPEPNRLAHPLRSPILGRNQPHLPEWPAAAVAHGSVEPTATGVLIEMLPVSSSRFKNQVSCGLPHRHCRVGARPALSPGLGRCCR